MYVTADEVRQIVARDDTQHDVTAASLSDDQINEAIDSASNEVNSRLAAQYIVPFAEPPDTPPLVAEIVRDIAAFLSDLTFRQDTDYTTGNEPMLLRYQRSIDLLTRLEAGTMTLIGVPTQPEVPQSPSVSSSVRNPYEGKLFGLEDFNLGYEDPRCGRWPR